MIIQDSKNQKEVWFFFFLLQSLHAQCLPNTQKQLLLGTLDHCYHTHLRTRDGSRPVLVELRSWVIVRALCSHPFAETSRAGGKHQSVVVAIAGGASPGDPGYLAAATAYMVKQTRHRQNSKTKTGPQTQQPQSTMPPAFCHTAEGNGLSL